MRNSEYRKKLKELNKIAWNFYRRHVSHQTDKDKTGIKQLMEKILYLLQELIEESERI